MKLRPVQKSLRLGILLVVFVAGLHAAPDTTPLADAVDISVWTSPESLTVGDAMTLEVRVAAPTGYEVALPPGAPPGASSKVSVRAFALEEPGTEAHADSAPATWIGRYTLAVYDVGEITLPPWPVQVRADTLIAVLHTDSIRIFVESVLDDSLAAAEPRDIKPQRDIDVPLPGWVVPTIVAVAMLAVLLVWLYRRRRRVESVVPVAPLRPAHEVALAELRELESLRLPYDGRIKEHYVRLSTILRTYLENGNQFRVAALEETTYEILRELEEKHYKRSVVDEIAAMCEEADLVKFAKHEPTVEECLGALERLRRFIIDSSKTSARFALRDSEMPQPVGVAVASGSTSSGAPTSAPREPASSSSNGSAGREGGRA